MKLCIILALSCVLAPVQAASYFTELIEDLSTAPGLSIDPQYRRRYTLPAHMRFVITPYEDSNTATLEIVLSYPLPENGGAVGYRLRRNDIDFIAENYVRHEGNRITVDLPALKADEHIVFLVGWEGRQFPYRKIRALLTTEQGNRAANWTSRALGILIE